MPCQNSASAYDWGSDVADWLRDGGPAHAGKIIRDLLVDYQPPAVPEPEPPPADEELYVSPDEIRDNSHYRLVGLEQLNFVFWLKSEGQLHVVPRTKITRVEELIALAPDVFWRNIASTDKSEQRGLPGHRG